MAIHKVNIHLWVAALTSVMRAGAKRAGANCRKRKIVNGSRFGQQNPNKSSSKLARHETYNNTVNWSPYTWTIQRHFKQQLAEAVKGRQTCTTHSHHTTQWEIHELGAQQLS